MVNITEIVGERGWWKYKKSTVLSLDLSQRYFSGSINKRNSKGKEDKIIPYHTVNKYILSHDSLEEGVTRPETGLESQVGAITKT